MILHAYFARRFFARFMAIMALLFSLVLVVDLIDQLNEFGDTSATFHQILVLTVMKSTGTLDDLIPLNLLLATVLLFIGLARSSEMVVTRATGRSAIRALFAPLAVALGIGIVTVTIFGPLAAALSNRYATLANSYRIASSGPAALSVSDEGLWLRQGDETAQTVIRAARSNPDGSVLFGVTFLNFLPEGAPFERIEARSAALADGAWQLQDVKRWPLGADAASEAQSEQHTEYTIPSTLTIDRIRETLGQSAGISLWDMPRYIAQLEQAGFSAVSQRVWLQSELARPLFLIAMVLIGAALTMRHTRLGGTGRAVITSLLLGFALYFMRSFAEILGENGQLDVTIAAWSVPIAANLLAIGLLLHAEDG